MRVVLINPEFGDLKGKEPAPSRRRGEGGIHFLPHLPIEERAKTAGRGGELDATACAKSAF
jgi:hypothetical protein